MLQAIDALRAFTAGKSFADFMQDRMLRAAVEREFEILGEALNRLHRDDPSTAGRFREPWKIIGFRNVIVHEYDDVDYGTVWSTIHEDLPFVRGEVEALLSEPDDPEE